MQNKRLGLIAYAGKKHWSHYLLASRYGAKTWYGGRKQTPEGHGQLFKVTPSKVKGHPEINLPYICPMATKVGQKKPSPEHSALLGSKGICHVNLGQPKVNFPYYATKFDQNPVKNVVHCWGQRSCRR